MSYILSLDANSFTDGDSWNPHAPARLTTEKVKENSVRTVTKSEKLEIVTVS